MGFKGIFTAQTCYPDVPLFLCLFTLSFDYFRKCSKFYEAIFVHCHHGNFLLNMTSVCFMVSDHFSAMSEWNHTISIHYQSSQNVFFSCKDCKFLLVKTQFCRTFLYVIIVILEIFVGHLSDRIKYFVSQNEILLVLTDRPALLVKITLVLLGVMHQSSVTIAPLIEGWGL